MFLFMYVLFYVLLGSYPLLVYLSLPWLCPLECCQSVCANVLLSLYEVLAFFWQGLKIRFRIFIYLYIYIYIYIYIYYRCCCSMRIRLKGYNYIIIFTKAYWVTLEKSMRERSEQQKKTFLLFVLGPPYYIKYVLLQLQ